MSLFTSCKLYKGIFVPISNIDHKTKHAEGNTGVEPIGENLYLVHGYGHSPKEFEKEAQVYVDEVYGGKK